MSQIIVRRGEQIRIPFTHTEDDGTVIDISSKTIKFNISKVEGGTVELTKTGALTTDGTDGAGYVDLTGSDTSGLDAGKYLYEFWLVDGANKTAITGTERLYIEEVIDIPS